MTEQQRIEVPVPKSLGGKLVPGSRWYHEKHGMIRTTGAPFQPSEGSKKRFVPVAQIGQVGDAAGKEILVNLRDFGGPDPKASLMGDDERDAKAADDDPERRIDMDPDPNPQPSEPAEPEHTGGQGGDETIEEVTPADPEPVDDAPVDDEPPADGEAGIAEEPSGQTRIAVDGDPVFSTDLGGTPPSEGSFHLTGQWPATHDADRNASFLLLIYATVAGSGIKKGKKQITLEAQAHAELDPPAGKTPLKAVMDVVDMRGRPERERPIIDNALSTLVALLTEDGGAEVDDLEDLEDRLRDKLYDRFSIDTDASGARDLEDGEVYARAVRPGMTIVIPSEPNGDGEVEDVDATVETVVELERRVFRFGFVEDDLEPVERRAKDPVRLAVPAPAPDGDGDDGDVIDGEVIEDAEVVPDDEQDETLFIGDGQGDDFLGGQKREAQPAEPAAVGGDDEIERW
jgi:hypothetical protein